MNEIEKLTRLLKGRSDVRLAVLFGSAAKGGLRSGSDIDIGLSFEKGAALTPALSAALDRAAERPVDVVLLDDAPPLLRFEVARDGSSSLNVTLTVGRTSAHAR